MASVVDLPREVPVSIKMPIGAARRMIEAAEREWGTSSVHEIAPGVSRVLFWLGGRRQYVSQSSTRPVGGFWVRWEFPSAGQATIERIGWDLAAGSSEAEVRQVIDLLAGWPIATAGVSRKVGAA
jgi:hypothetical protein